MNKETETMWRKKSNYKHGEISTSEKGGRGRKRGRQREGVRRGRSVEEMGGRVGEASVKSETTAPGGRMDKLMEEELQGSRVVLFKSLLCRVVLLI